MPLILQHFVISRACCSDKCSLVFKQTIGHLVIHGVLLLASVTELSTAPCFFYKIYSAAKIRPKNLPSKCELKWPVSCFLHCFLKLTGHCVNTQTPVRGFILRSLLIERRPASGCLTLQSPNFGFTAVTDRKWGVNLRAISAFCTGLLTVFLNSKVTGLAGQTSYFILSKSFGTVPGWPQWPGDCITGVTINRGFTAVYIMGVTSRGQP